MEFVYLQDAIDATTFTDDNQIDIVLIPPEPDQLSDLDEIEEENFAGPMPNDVPGTVEVTHNSSDTDEAMDDDDEWCKSECPLYPSFSRPLSNQAAINSSLRLAALADLDEVGVLKQLFDDGLISLIVRETNRYANTQHNDHTFRTNHDEILTFIAILILSGYNKLPHQHHYWSSSTDLGVAIVRQAMTRDRFTLIKKYIHFANNNSVDTTDKSFKIKPLLKIINSNFMKWSLCNKDLSIDETIVPYFGRSSLKQFIKGKPVRFGFKMWCLAGNDGFCYQTSLYTGRETTHTAGNLGTRVVNNFVDLCISNPSSHTLTFDNFFTSISLLTSLADKGIRATGTIRKNRLHSVPLINEKEMKKQDRGSFDHCYNNSNGVLVVRWKDSAVVNIATNHEHVTPLSVCSRRGRGLRLQVQQPAVFHSYNQTMGGVDLFDQHVATYRIGFRSKKWYWPIFLQAIDAAVSNAWILFRQMSASTTQLEFRRAICVSLLQKATAERAPPNLSVSPLHSIRYDNIGHLIVLGDGQRKCRLEACQSRPRTFCRKCSVPLCVACFEQFHKKSH